MNTKTYQKKAGEVEHKWVLVDAANLPLGRVATFVANRLMGKYDPTYTAHMDAGDNVVVINADQMVYNGDRRAKKYYRHSEFPGALKEIKAEDVSLSEMLERSVAGMLPKNKLRDARVARLRVYAGADHSNTAQQPVKLEVK